jgi:hypothetical protein
MLHEAVGTTDVLQPRKPNLGDDSSKLTRRRRDAMRRTPVPRRECFARGNADSGVGAKVREEVAEAVQEDEGARTYSCRVHGVVREAHDDEQNSEHSKSHGLDGLAADTIDGEYTDICTGNLTGYSQDQVSDTDVAQVLVHCRSTCDGGRRTTKADGVENDGGVEAEPIERYLQQKRRRSASILVSHERAYINCKPAPACTNEYLLVLPLREVLSEVAHRRPRHGDAAYRPILVYDEGPSLEEVVDVVGCLSNIALDVHREPWCLRDGESVVECDGTRNTTEADE